MQTYLVGGAVRDELLGLPVKDRDYLVVGATPAQMLAQGYQPVGREFPVFLHPQTHEEYALARTERKSGRGYAGFTFHTAPDVRLEDDLARRDLTVNAIAKADDGTLIDPFGGVADLRARILRHVSPAFAEDPVRILRLARFAARFADFSVAPETLALAQRMVREGEIDHLIPERVWQELARGLMEQKPSRMIQVLRECGALMLLLPELDRLFGVPQRADYHPEVDTGIHIAMAVDCAAANDYALPVRFAVLLHDLGKGTTPTADLPRHPGHEGRGVKLVEAVCARLRAPAEARELARLVARYHGDIRRGRQLRPATVLKLLQGCDALRRPQRFEQILQACKCDFHGRLGWENRTIPDADYFPRALLAARSVDAAGIARACIDSGKDARKISERIAVARVKAIAALDC